MTATRSGQTQRHPAGALGSGVPRQTKASKIALLMALVDLRGGHDDFWTSECSLGRVRRLMQWMSESLALRRVTLTPE
jgi:hypothetical protein